MSQIASLDEVAAQLKALGDPTRLRIFTFLSRCCCPVALDDSGGVRLASGPTVGEVCCRITGGDRITSTLSHHLKELRLAGLITMERRGRHRICGVNRDALESIRNLLDACAKGESGDECC